MKNLIIAIILITISNNTFAQEPSTFKGAKIGWFITPEVGTMFLKNHVGKSVGFAFGFKLWKERLKVGFISYGRSGPINRATFNTKFYNNQTYRGKSTTDVRADWGTFGLLLAPTFKIKKISIDVPIMLGGGAGGFYLFGDDRITPDGDRVSVWENKLFNGEDAGFGGLAEIGARVFLPTKIKGITYCAGLHYTITSGWKTNVDPSGNFYNNKLRASLFLNFGSH
jgi:hypothetical protein